MKKFILLLSIFLFGLLVISSGCHYNPSSGGPLAPKKIPSLSDSGLTGSWQWIYTSGWPVGIIYPNSPGYNFSRKIEFADDSLFSYFRNDTLVETAKYHVFWSDSTEYPWQISLQDIAYTKFDIGFGSYENITFVTLKGDTLNLIPDISDVPNDTYVLTQ